MRLITALVGFTVAIVAPLSGADSELEHAQHALACDVLGADHQDIYIALNHAAPGQLVPANAFNLHNGDVTGDVCVNSGGTVTFHNTDVLLRHRPVSEWDDLLFGAKCFDVLRDTQQTLGPGESFTMAFRYDGETRHLMASSDDGTTFRDCQSAVRDATEAYAVVPWHDYDFPQPVRGVILVATS